MGSEPGRKTVSVLTCAADNELARQVERIAREEGFGVASGSTAKPSELCLVLLSHAAVDDSEFLRRAEDAVKRSPSAIPVRIDEVRPEEAGRPGSAIRERNWADFSGESRRDPDSWKRLLHSNVNLYSSFYDLDERSRRWDACDHDVSFLLQDVKAARQAKKVLSALAADPYQRPTKTMQEYVNTSERYARKTRSKEHLSIARAFSSFLVIAIALSALNFAVRRYQNYSGLLEESMQGFDMSSDPAYAAFRALEIGRDKNINSDAVYYQTIDALSLPWEVSELGLVEKDAGVGNQSQAVFCKNGETLLIRGPNGTLQTWLPQTAEATDNRYVSDEERFSFDATPDGSRVAVADAKGLRVFDGSTWERTDIPYDGDPITSVAISADGTEILAAGSNGLTLVSTLDESVMASLDAEPVLSVKRTQDGLRALVIKDGAVLFVDGETMAPLAHTGLSDAPDCTGALGPEGRAILWTDGRLLTLSPDSSSEPIGFSVSERPLDMAVTGNTAVIATAENGVQVIDLPTGALLGTLATQMAGVRYLSVAESGLVSCGNGITTSVYSLDGIVPSAEPPADALISDSLECNVPGASFGIWSDGGNKFVLADNGKEKDYTFQGTHGEPDDITAVAASVQPRSYVIGTRSGGVTTYTVTTDGIQAATRTWDTPDGSSVTAVGWTADGKRLVIRAGGRWWTPYSNSWAIGLQRIANTLAERSPAVWSASELETFPEDIVESMGMQAATPLPEPR